MSERLHCWEWSEITTYNLLTSTAVDITHGVEDRLYVMTCWSNAEQLLTRYVGEYLADASILVLVERSRSLMKVAREADNFLELMQLDDILAV